MKMTVVLFQIDFDCLSAVTADLERQTNAWKSTLDSRRDLLRRLDIAGLIGCLSRDQPGQVQEVVGRADRRPRS